MQETWFQSLDWEDPWRRKWQATAVFLPGKVHGQRSLAGYSPRRLKESHMAEWVSTQAWIKNREIESISSFSPRMAFVHAVLTYPYLVHYSFLQVHIPFLTRPDLFSPLPSFINQDFLFFFWILIPWLCEGYRDTEYLRLGNPGWL